MLAINDRQVRAVTHLDVSADDTNQAVEILKQCANEAAEGKAAPTAAGEATRNTTYA